MSRDLLKDLAMLANCEYISDLRYLPEPDIIKVLVKDFIIADVYSLWDWNQAVSYFTYQDISFTSAGEAKKYLLKARLPRR